MARYTNGELPDSELVWFWAENQFGRMERFRATPATAARWEALVLDVRLNEGVTLQITSGPNVYRDLAQQIATKAEYVAKGKPMQAATPRYSSHGGNYAGPFTGWRRVDAMAVDVWNWRDIGWTTFKYYAEKHGFAVDVVEPEELWHIVDFAPFTMPTKATSVAPETIGENVFIAIRKGSYYLIIPNSGKQSAIPLGKEDVTKDVPVVRFNWDESWRVLKQCLTNPSSVVD